LTDPSVVVFFVAHLVTLSVSRNLQRGMVRGLRKYEL